MISEELNACCEVISTKNKEKLSKNVIPDFPKKKFQTHNKIDYNTLHNNE